MKKLSLYILLSLSLFCILFSCSKQDISVAQRMIENNSSTRKITMSNVRSYISTIKGVPDTKSETVSIDPILNGADTVMYIINYENGWEVLSGDSRTPVVLMKSDSGNLSISDLTATPESFAFFRAMSDGLSSIMNDDAFEAPEYVNDTWDDFFPLDSFVHIDPIRDTVLLSIDTLGVYTVKCQDHLLSTKWGQGSPWNIYAPYTDSTLTNHCPTGCVPVAFAQVLYYLHSKIGAPLGTYGNADCTAFVPSSGSLVLSDAEVSFYNYSNSHWDSMPLTQSSSGNPGLVSALMVRLGYLFNATYHPASTGVGLYWLRANAQSILSDEFSISSSLIDYNWTSFAQYMDEQIYENELPALMGIQRVVSENPVVHAGHYVVIDGYKVVNYSLRYNYVVHSNVRPDYYYSTEALVPSAFVAINWGWNGLFDSTNGSTNWFNIFDCWVVGNQNTTLNYSIKDHFICNFGRII